MHCFRLDSSHGQSWAKTRRVQTEPSLVYTTQNMFILHTLVDCAGSKIGNMRVYLIVWMKNIERNRKKFILILLINIRKLKIMNLQSKKFEKLKLKLERL